MTIDDVTPSNGTEAHGITPGIRLRPEHSPTTEILIAGALRRTNGVIKPDSKNPSELVDRSISITKDINTSFGSIFIDGPIPANFLNFLMNHWEGLIQSFDPLSFVTRSEFKRVFLKNLNEYNEDTVENMKITMMEQQIDKIVGLFYN